MDKEDQDESILDTIPGDAYVTVKKDPLPSMICETKQIVSEMKKVITEPYGNLFV